MGGLREKGGDEKCKVERARLVYSGKNRGLYTQRIAPCHDLEARLEPGSPRLMMLLRLDNMADNLAGNNITRLHAPPQDG